MATKRLRISLIAIAAIGAIFATGLSAASSGDGQTDASQVADTAPALSADTTGAGPGPAYDPIVSSTRAASDVRKFDRTIRLEDELDPDEEPDINVIGHSRVVIAPTSINGRSFPTGGPKVNPGTPEEDCWNIARLTC